MNSLKFVLNRGLLAVGFVWGLFLGQSFVSEIPSYAGTLELGGTFSFSRSNYGPSNFNWTRRWGATVGYFFWGFSEIEFSFQDVLYRTKLDGDEDTTFHDRIYSVDWVQSFASRHAALQPYLKVGIGQLNREAYGSYADGDSPPAVYDSLTGVVGAGLRISLFQSFGLRVEGTSYLTGGVLNTWKDNFSFNAGFSIYL